MLCSYVVATVKCNECMMRVRCICTRDDAKAMQGEIDDDDDDEERKKK